MPDRRPRAASLNQRTSKQSTCRNTPMSRKLPPGLQPSLGLLQPVSSVRPRAALIGKLEQSAT
jgi:hypothetical protein